jgi:hypothetical protein
MENVTRRQVELIHKSIVSGGCDKRVFLFFNSFSLIIYFYFVGKKNYNTCRDGAINSKEKKGRARLYSARNHLYISLPFHRDCFNDFPIIKRKKKNPHAPAPD